ncbi:MAG TPA: gephyrin-like molybdotransferase Glp [Clostridia bacterium]|nr:gephyrin-like molybdotransferase Glp [Clostridia bacterium]
MLEVKSVSEVIRIIDDNFSIPGLESDVLRIEEAVGRIAAEDLKAPEDIPGFSRSSVDGYAVISADTFGASESTPAQLMHTGEVKMGEKPQLSLKNGQAVYIPTGGEMPGNADAVVMVEYTENLDDGYVYIQKSAAPGNSVVYKGDDVKAGDLVIKSGTRLRPQDVGVLAAMGYSRIAVRRKIRVGIVSTGDEIIGVDEKPTGAQVRDINSYALYAGLLEHGAQPELYGIVKDNFENIRQVVDKALQHSDIVLVSGGSSAGARDETRKVIDSLGSPGVLVHGIAVKPGKPTILGKIGEKAVIGLPGHPASAYSIFKAFVCHLIDVMDGRKDELKPAVRAIMSCKYPSNSGREEFLPVELGDNEGKLYASPVFGKSGLITLLTAADGYVHISRGSEGVDQGSEVEVFLF